MAKEKDAYPEIKHIKEDLDSLRNNVVELTRHIQENGTDQAAELSKLARKRLERLQAKGTHQFEKVESRVKERPSQSLAVAFIAGLVTSMLMGRRG